MLIIIQNMKANDALIKKLDLERAVAENDEDDVGIFRACVLYIYIYVVLLTI